MLCRAQVWPRLIHSFVSIGGCHSRPDDHEGTVVGSLSLSVESRLSKVVFIVFLDSMNLVEKEKNLPFTILA